MGLRPRPDGRAQAGGPGQGPDPGGGRRAGLPAAWRPGWRTSPTVGQGEEKPAGLVINHVLDELTHTEGSQFKGKTWQSIEDGGYSIITTLDRRRPDGGRGGGGRDRRWQRPERPAGEPAGGPGRGRAGHRPGPRLLRRSRRQGQRLRRLLLRREQRGHRRRPAPARLVVQDLRRRRRAEGGLLAELVLAMGRRTSSPAETDNNPIRNASYCATDCDPATEKGKTGACTLLAVDHRCRSTCRSTT